MMHDQQVGAEFDRLADGGGARIDGSGDFTHGAIVLDLQSVHGARPVSELPGLQSAVAVAHDGIKPLLFHGRDVSATVLKVSSQVDGGGAKYFASDCCNLA